jgi:hypothetical protein
LGLLWGWLGGSASLINMVYRYGVILGQVDESCCCCEEE